jgi:hypothetical protein
MSAKSSSIGSALRQPPSSEAGGVCTRTPECRSPRPSILCPTNVKICRILTFHASSSVRVCSIYGHGAHMVSPLYRVVISFQGSFCMMKQPFLRVSCRILPRTTLLHLSMMESEVSWLAKLRHSTAIQMPDFINPVCA